jgi:hypothetical protein
VLGIPWRDCYEMTPRELRLVCDGRINRRRADIELVAAAVRVGYVNARKGKNKKVFGSDKEAGATGTIGVDEKRRRMAELKAIFG